MRNAQEDYKYSKFMDKYLESHKYLRNEQQDNSK